MLSPRNTFPTTQLISLIFPIMLGYSAAAIAFGALAAAWHWQSAIIVGFSLLLYSGALQSTVLGLTIVNPSFALVFTLSLAVNLRHMLYGPHLQTRDREWKRLDRWVIGGLLTDELYALGLDPSLNRKQWRAAGLMLYGCWAASTAVGVASAHVVPHQWLLAMSLALPSLFMGLLIPRLSSQSDWLAALVAAALAALGRWLHWPDAYIIIPIAMGASAGYWAQRRKVPTSS